MTVPHENISSDLLSRFSCDYAEIRFEKKKMGQCHFRGVEKEELSVLQTSGGAARVRVRGAWGFCSFRTPKEAPHALKKARKLAAALPPRKQKMKPLKVARETWVVSPKVDPFTVPWSEKLSLLEKYNRLLRKRKAITMSQVRYRELCLEKEFLNSEGTHILQKKWDVAIRLAAVAKEGGNVQLASYDDGSMKGFSIVQGLEEKAKSVAALACDLLRAEPCPSGIFPTLCDPEVTGLFAHEAFGHLSEADFAENNQSLQKLMQKGKRFGKPILNICDNGTLPFHQGTWKYDDEGVPMEETQLVNRGVFAHRLHNRETALQFKESLTGNARAISFAFPPIIRMTNTYILPHRSSIEEMLDQIDYGIYACGDRGGQTNCEVFTFTPAYGYLIEKGKKKKLLRDVTLSGNVFDTLAKVTKIGSDFRMIGGLGGCGKEGQSPLPVTLGGPHILIQKVIVGGK